MDILLQKHKKKPTELKLINYIKDIIGQWMEIILHGFNETDDLKKKKSKRDAKNPGYIFLSQPNLDFDWLFKKEEKYTELKLYDIWKWDEEQLTKKLKFEITLNDNLDKKIYPDSAQLYVMKSNNYEKVYDGETKQDVWDTKNCPYNQMGVNRDNPNNLSKCIYIDPAKLKKQYKNTWKETEFGKPEEISIYNTKTFKNDNNQLFYPVGSVWRGRNTDERRPDTQKFPHSLSKCGDGHGTLRNQKYNDKGPEKDTVLVSGDVVKPASYKKIWDSKKKCPECQVSATQIFRPIAPKGYKCLGDVAIPWTNDDTDSGKENQRRILDNLNIRCVPKKCVREKSLGPKIWHNRNLDKKEYKDYIAYTSKTPKFQNSQLKTSFWEAGNRNSGEEIMNRYGIQLEENGGYNLFRASSDYDLKPKEKTYVIKEECLMPAGGKIPEPLQFNMSKLKDKSTDNSLYSTEFYFGTKPQQAILTNFDSDFDTKLHDINDNSVYSPTFNNKSKINKGGARKKFYLVNDNSKRKKDKPDEPDTYFIKTYNEKKNDFSSCLKYDEINNKVVISPICNPRKSEFRWYLDYKGNYDKLVSNKKVHVKSLFNDKCLKNYYNEKGENISVLVDCGILTNTIDTNNKEEEEELKGSNIWLYQTLINQPLPKKKKS